MKAPLYKPVPFASLQKKWPVRQAPLILVSSYTVKEGGEFADFTTNVSYRYSNALQAAGGLPVSLPCLAGKTLIREYVRRCTGVMLTGGEDVRPALHTERMPAALKGKTWPHEPERDVMEQILIEEVFRQKKPLLAICRGHQMLNVALGGTLFLDIPTQCPGTLNHRQMDRRCEPVHGVQLAETSLLANLCGCKTLQVNSTHHQAVKRVAAPLKVTGRSDDGITEVMELKDGRVLPFLLSVQFHPERLFDRYAEFGKMFAGFVAACAED